jgi:hypothetical protein
MASKDDVLATAKEVYPLENFYLLVKGNQDPGYVSTQLEKLKGSAPQEKKSSHPLTPSQEELRGVFDLDLTAHLLTHLPNLPDKACQVSRDLVTRLRCALASGSFSIDMLNDCLPPGSPEGTVITKAGWYTATVSDLVKDGYNVTYGKVIFPVPATLSQCVKIVKSTAEIYSRHGGTALHVRGESEETETSEWMNLTIWVLEKEGSNLIFPGTGFVSNYTVMDPNSPDAPMSLLFKKGGVDSGSITTFLTAYEGDNIWGLLPNDDYRDLLVKEGKITTTASAAAVDALDAVADSTKLTYKTRSSFSSRR